MSDLKYDLEEARRIFKNDRYAMETSGIDILEVADGYAKCCFVPNASHKNARGAVMGGALFTLADFTFAVASNFNQPRGTVTNVSQISFLRGVSEGTVYAESRLIKQGKTCCTYQIDITNDKNELVAVVMASGIHIPKVSEEI